MIYNYNSGFADKLNSFVTQKQALGFSYTNPAYNLSRFDKMCCSVYPDASVLSKEICNAWAVKKPTERANAFRDRLSAVREFGKYLVRNGEEAYVIPPNIAKKDAKPIPYIYSTDEIAAVWQEFDKFSSNKRYPVRHLVFPAIIRIIYCCGLRPCEARKLMASDVDLTTGKLFIRESKGRKDRIVMMADDVCIYMNRYNDKVNDIAPQRNYFFPNPDGGLYSEKRLCEIFAEVRKNLGILGTDLCKPKLYGFRHSFATHRLYQWLNEGCDLNAMLPYLSAYMGHSQLTDTYYYIHLVPGQFKAMSGMDFSYYEDLLPEVECHE